MKDIDIYNNPFLFDTGANLVMTINDCSLATAAEEKRGIVPYSSATCIPYDDAQQYIPSVRVNWKIMAQNFNPDYYAEHNEMQPVIKHRFNTDLMKAFTSSTKFGIIKNDIRFFDYWFVDLRDFLFFLPGFLANNPKMNLVDFTFDPLGTAIFSGSLTKDLGYGYY